MTRLTTRLIALTACIACGSGGGESSGPPPPPPSAAVASVDVQPTSGTIDPGQTLQLTATPRDAAGTALTRAVTWSTSAAAVATVSSTGLVTALTAGSATITATSETRSGTSAINVPPFLATACTGGNPVVALVVDRRLSTGVLAAMARFESDLCADGYTVLRTRQPFASPVELKTELKNLFAQTNGRLTGAILIGEQPRAYQYVTLVSTNPNIPSSNEETISYQFYADLDGTFSASTGYQSPGGKQYSYDQHTGNTSWEIWVGVLPMYQGDLARTEQALVRYFQKNHDYRTGVNALPRAFVQVSEHATAATQTEYTNVLASFRTGQYAWQPFSTAASTRIYFNSPPASLTVDQGYAALSRGDGDFFVGEAHGSYLGHGKLSITWAESNPVRTAFFWSDGCAVANLDQPSNFLSSILYATGSTVVVAKGTTNNSGGLGTNQDGFYGRNVATHMSSGLSFGAAVMKHVNVPLISPWLGSREFHFATAVLLGDPTLRLRP
jgi:Big-like domain-containing protein